VLPNDVDDPSSPSGGNHYDRRLLSGLGRLGWSVQEYQAWGSWPTPRPADVLRLSDLLASLPEDGPVLVDGLVASAAPELFLSLAPRLVVLVHRAFGTGAEAVLFEACRAVVTTSRWSADSMPGRVTSAPPGVDPAPIASGSPAGLRLLCVAVVAPHKGQDLLMAALAAVPGPGLHVVGSLERDPAYADAVRAAAPPGRVRFAGPLVGPALDAAYAQADLLVLPSRGESYGMVVTEALARGIPVLATAVGGVPEAVGRLPDGRVPGLLVQPTAPALSAALRAWVADPMLRARLRQAALERRAELVGWDATAATVSAVLAA
jgi:glycosyltransferase involved in cell wall biosynthesis